MYHATSATSDQPLCPSALEKRKIFHQVRDKFVLRLRDYHYDLPGEESQRIPFGLL